MQDIFLCCAAADRVATEPLIAALTDVDALTLTVEVCEPGELPEACAAGSDAAGVVLLLSTESVPGKVTRQLWQPVLDRAERAPSTLASVQLEPCAFPASLKTRSLLVDPGEAARALQRWAVALDPAERFEVFGFAGQYEFRDVSWIPCAGRERESVQEDLALALDGRRILIVLDRCPSDVLMPVTTRERIVVHTPEERRAAGPLPPGVATCYPDFLHRDFCARVADMEPVALAALLEPLSRDGRILRVPLEARRHFDYESAPWRRHAELLAQILSSPGAADQAQLIRLELPAALEFCFGTDWNFAAGLAWRAREVLKGRWPGETTRLLLRLRQSAVDHKVRSWVDLCEQELHWMGVDIPTVSATKSKVNTHQLTLDW
ncbi:MAG: hypothetical protein SGI92_07415 [Bryobacteraceae bacterium]|nr:hypothetical protein [Bryobacteraceae bacterium]